MPRLPERSDVFAREAVGDALGPLVRSGAVVGVLADAVRFVDATILSVLVDARDRARRHGGDLVLVDASPAMRITLELTGLSAHLPFVDGDVCSRSMVLVA